MENVNFDKFQKENHMIKLYFKKLLSMVVYLLLCGIIYRVAFGLLFSIANIFKNPITDMLVLFGIPLAISIVIVYIRRTRNDKIRRAYLKELDDSKYCFDSELKYMLVFQDFRAEILSFSTLSIILFIFSALNTHSPWYAYLILFSVICLTDILAIIIDFGLWLLVHRAWRKDELR